MAQISPSEDIRSVTDLKRNTRDILDHLHATGRPVILTVNGRADSVLLDVRVYEKHLQAGNLAKLLAPAERDVESGRTRPARDFLKEFKRAKKNKG
ncbi:MAG: type II toxin-antitoxin system Phd/YefM family antitoxin [Proteobacteria bacterium]|jgi:prevent-host-death family protein|nr:type II toxin-antitoxin system Phd/YefM family antitoxin [Pseudomonadota bacterium]